MAPEQAKGGEADERSNIDSAACCSKMLTGRRPFEGEDMTMCRRGRPPRATLEGTPVRCPRARAALLGRCLVKDRRRRIGDIAAVLSCWTPGRSRSGRAGRAAIEPHRMAGRGAGDNRDDRGAVVAPRMPIRARSRPTSSIHRRAA